MGALLLHTFVGAEFGIFAIGRSQAAFWSSEFGLWMTLARAAVLGPPVALWLARLFSAFCRHVFR